MRFTLKSRKRLTLIARACCAGLLILALLGIICGSELNLPVARGRFQPTAESQKQYQCPEWFRDAKFGIWAHWGPQAVPMDGDWYARGM